VTPGSGLPNISPNSAGFVTDQCRKARAIEASLRTGSAAGSASRAATTAWRTSS
jgi:hypothetical protein